MNDHQEPPNRSPEPDLGDAILLDGLTFFVRYRRSLHGPFAVEWASDLRGLEMTCQGQKFGEVCGSEQLFADLSEFRLPGRVATAAVIAFGELIRGVESGEHEGCAQRIRTALTRHSEIAFAVGHIEQTDGCASRKAR